MLIMPGTELQRFRMGRVPDIIEIEPSGSTGFEVARP